MKLYIIKVFGNPFVVCDKKHLQHWLKEAATLYTDETMAEEDIEKYGPCKPEDMDYDEVILNREII